MNHELIVAKDNKKFSHLQLKYNLIQALYWGASCALIGFIAIFLQSKGLTNTQIGTVTGASCVINIFLSPTLSTLTSKFNRISLQAYVLSGMVLTGLSYILIGYVPLPTPVLMLMYTLTHCINVSLVPLIASIQMNYNAQGHSVNFGIARGMGSITYAISAVACSNIASWLNPTILTMIYITGSLLLAAALFATPKTYAAGAHGEKGGNLFHMVFEYKAFFGVLFGFALLFAATTSLSTYLINIIKNLGGTQELYGIAVFTMAATEMPVMAIASKLQKRFSAMQLFAMAAIFYVMRNLFIANATSLIVLIFGLMMQGFSYGLMTAVITVYVNDNLKPKDQVMGQTMISVMTCGLGSAIGNIFGGVIQDTLGIEMMFAFTDTLTIVGSSIIVLTAIMASKAIFHRLHKSYQM